MQNTFDFYFVVVAASTKTALKRAGIDSGKIERRRAGSVAYGNRVFPRWSYQTTVGYFELTQSAEAEACAAKFKIFDGVTAGVSYHAAD